MYTSTVMDHFERPRRVGRLEAPDAVGIAGKPGAGPFMALYLKAAEGHIIDASYQTYGCAPAIAAGSLLSEWLIGRPVAACRSFTEEELVTLLGGLPDHKLFCAALAVAALRAALTRLP